MTIQELGAAIVFGILVAVIVSFVVVSAWHYLTPESMQWLSQKRIARMKSLLLTWAMGGVFALLAQKLFEN